MFSRSGFAALAAVMFSATVPAFAQVAEAVDSTARGGVVALADRVATLERIAVALHSDLVAAQGRIGTLEAGLSAAQGRIGALETELAAAQLRIGVLETGLAAAEGRLTASEAAVAGLQDDLAGLQASPVFALSGFVADLAGCVTVDEVLRDIDGDGLAETLPRVLVEACNLQVANGTGNTASRNGLGNLIVGYDEERPDTAAAFLETCSDGQYDNETDCIAAGRIWAQNHKSGSHNLVVGTHNNYASFGGAVFGVINTINNQYATVTAGSDNIASGFFSTVGGGLYNTARGDWSSIGGGLHNLTTDYTASILGGQANTASGKFSTVSGGESNRALGDGSSVSGGLGHATTDRSNWAAGSLYELN